jgi:hypothetical protein
VAGPADDVAGPADDVAGPADDVDGPPDPSGTGAPLDVHAVTISAAAITAGPSGRAHADGPSLHLPIRGRVPLILMRRGASGGEDDGASRDR